MPDPAGVAHAPSPRQNVDAEAPVPPARFATGRLPVTSEARSMGSTGTVCPCKLACVFPRTVFDTLCLLPHAEFHGARDPDTGRHEHCECPRRVAVGGI